LAGECGPRRKTLKRTIEQAAERADLNPALISLL
jgi:hypothetical protein